jgi:Lrp/AsnC family transcriptional regulator, regulator for asnA, asnC and gidA
MDLDETSRRIIALLAQDGRMSYALLGRSVKLSEAAVRQRVQRLTESGVLRIACLVAPERLGFSRAATLGVRCGGAVDAAAKAIDAVDGVQRSALTSGSIDVMVSVIAKDDEDLLRAVNEIRRIEGVRDVEVFMHLDRHGPEVIPWSYTPEVE